MQYEMAERFAQGVYEKLIVMYLLYPFITSKIKPQKTFNTFLMLLLQSYIICEACFGGKNLLLLLLVLVLQSIYLLINQITYQCQHWSTREKL